MRLDTHLDYIKNFNYLQFYKKKNCEYFRPLSNIILGTNNQQIECAILNKEVINRIKASLPKQRNNMSSTAVSCIYTNYSTNIISVLNPETLHKIKKLS